MLSLGQNVCAARDIRAISLHSPARKLQDGVQNAALFLVGRLLEQHCVARCVTHHAAEALSTDNVHLLRFQLVVVDHCFELQTTRRRENTTQAFVSAAFQGDTT